GVLVGRQLQIQHSRQVANARHGRAHSDPPGPNDVRQAPALSFGVRRLAAAFHAYTPPRSPLPPPNPAPPSFRAEPAKRGRFCIARFLCDESLWHFAWGHPTIEVRSCPQNRFLIAGRCSLVAAS